MHAHIPLRSDPGYNLHLKNLVQTSANREVCFGAHKISLFDETKHEFHTEVQIVCNNFMLFCVLILILAKP